MTVTGYWLLWSCIRIVSSMTIDIDGTDSQGVSFEHFWTSTGFSPTPSSGGIKDFLLSKDEELNLAMIGSTPNDGITHVSESIGSLTSSMPPANTDPWEFGFESLDELLTTLHSNNLSPGFELMGNPSGCFRDWTKQSHQWTRFIENLIQRYIYKFGYAYILTWRFETLNEPDLKMYNSWNFTLPNYLSYVTASASTLQSFNLTLWGPAGLFKNSDHHPLCWGLLEHCNSHPCPVQVLSFHKKGDSHASFVSKLSQEFILQMNERYPNLSEIPVANDEADPMQGWIKPVRWRGDVRYAAAVVEIIISYLNSSRQNEFKLAAISSDNGFLSYWPHFWTQRTLLARFQMNDTVPPHVQFFRKPVHTAMGLTALLGDEITSLQYKVGNPGWSYVVTLAGTRRTSLIIVSNDSLVDETWINHSVNGVIQIFLPKMKTEGRGALYILDNKTTNPEKVWSDAGHPNFPKKQLRRKIRRKEGPKVVYFTIAANQTELQLEWEFSVPTILLTNLCYEDAVKPGPVQRLRYIQVAINEVLLLWDDAKVISKCLRAFVVEFRRVGSKKFKKIINNRELTTSYQIDGCSPQKRGACVEIDISGHYRVAAVDFWGRIGPYSNQILITPTK